jgi:YHS domain-containing protein
MNSAQAPTGGEDFGRRLRDHILAARAADTAGQTTLEAAMQSRLAAEDEMRERLLPVHRTVMRPAVEALAAAFSDATITHGSLPRGFTSQCKLNRSASFAATARFTATLEWGERGGAWLIARRDLIPALASFEAAERLAVHTGEPDAVAIRAWIEARVMEFSDACLAVTREAFYRGGMVRMDPVCGMEVWTQEKADLLEYSGRAYAFCSAACRARFEAEPATYVAITAR